MDFFKKITTETKNPDKKNVVIMGRKTWFSIPEKHRPLPKRINIILSREMKEAPTGVYIARGLEEAIDLVKKDFEEKVESICIIGGSSVYKEAMESEYNCRIFLTRVLADFDCDTFLPEFDENLFRIVENYEGVPVGKQTENNIDFLFEVYEKEAMESEYNCRIFLTRVLADFDCDTFLPEFDENLFRIVENYEGVPVGKQTENNIDFLFEVYEKVGC